MSENPGAAHLPPTAWVHAGEVSHWVVVLLGWVWLGEQGMHVGWSMASGLLPVAVWWAVRLLGRGSDWGFRCSPWVFGLLGLLTASGIGLWSLMAALGVAQAGLLGLAVVWGLWGALIETRSPSSTFQLGSVAWHPVLAAVCVIGAWHLPEANTIAHLGTAVLLTLCAGCLFARDRGRPTPRLACPGPRTHAPSLLAPSAMGLMMGSLWLGDAWCVGLGWQTASMVVIHLCLMAGLPTCVAYLMRFTPQPCTSLHHTGASLALLALGALALWGEGPVFGVWAMLLPSLAWAFHCARPRLHPTPSDMLSPGWARSWTLLLGPVLLVWVGVLSPTHGPWAIHSALALLGGLAFLQLLRLWWRRQLMNLPLALPQKMEMPQP